MAQELLEVLDEVNERALLREIKASARWPTGRRNRAMILLALRAGLRSSEIVGHEKREGGGLRVRDVNLSTGELVVRGAKDTRPAARRMKRRQAGRRVWVQGDALEALRDYWKDRSAAAPGPEEYFFVTRSGARVTNSELRAAFRRYCARSGIDESFLRHPHALRHTFATRLAAKAPLHVVAAALGHASIRSSEVYLHASGDEVRRAMLEI